MMALATTRLPAGPGAKGDALYAGPPPQHGPRACGSLSLARTSAMTCAATVHLPIYALVRLVLLTYGHGWGSLVRGVHVHREGNGMQASAEPGEITEIALLKPANLHQRLRH